MCVFVFVDGGFVWMIYSDGKCSVLLGKVEGLRSKENMKWKIIWNIWFFYKLLK